MPTLIDIRQRWKDRADDDTLTDNERDAYQSLAYEAAEHGGACEDAVMSLIRGNTKIMGQVRENLRDGHWSPVSVCQRLDKSIARLEIYFDELEIVKAAS